MIVALMALADLRGFALSSFHPPTTSIATDFQVVGGEFLIIIVIMLSFFPFQAGTPGVIFALPRLSTFFLPEAFRLIFITAAMALFTVFIVVDTFLDMLFPDLGP